MSTSHIINTFLLTQGKYFKTAHLPLVRNHLEQLDESALQQLGLITFKDPIISIFISVFLGNLGIDRFYIGDTLSGIIKLCTFGACGIWTIIDWFLIIGLTKDKNFTLLLNKLILIKPSNNSAKNTPVTEI